MVGRIISGFCFHESDDTNVSKGCMKNLIEFSTGVFAYAVARHRQFLS